MTLIKPFRQKLNTVGIIAKREVKAQQAYLQRVVQSLQHHHKKILFDTNTAPLYKKNGHNKTELLQKCDLVIVLGGDGTLLKTARRIGKRKTLVMAFNFGTLGFLTESSPENIEEDLNKLFKNQYLIDKRSILRVTHYRKNKKLETCLALNDAVINQGSFARLIELDVIINQRRVTTFKADGLIVSSPTGSTAHSLSAGGPIVHPSLPGIILSPICPATLSTRPIVIPNDRQIKITLVPPKYMDKEDIGLTIDGQENTPLKYGDDVKIRRSSRCFYLARVKGTGNYYGMLREKLHWGELHGD